MVSAWQSYRGAPKPGTVLCQAVEVPEGCVKCLKIVSGDRFFPILVVNSRGWLKAFVNACPHQYLPLDHRGERVLSADGNLLRCTNHGASFRIIDGAGVEGLALGIALDEIPLRVGEDGTIIIAKSEDIP